MDYTIANNNGDGFYNANLEDTPAPAYGSVNGNLQSFPALDPRMDMYTAKDGFCPDTAMLANFIEENVALRLEVFQVIDSFKWHYEHTRLVPSLQQFKFETGLFPVNLMAIQAYLVHQLLVKGTDAGVKCLEQFRPATQALPIIPAIPLLTPPPSVTSPASQMTPPSGPGQQAYPPLSSYEPYDMAQLADMFPISREHGQIANREYEVANNQRGKRTGDIPSSVTADLPLDDASYRRVVNRLTAAMMDVSGEYLEKGKKKVRGPRTKDASGHDQPGNVIGHEDAMQAQRLWSKSPIVVKLAACKMVDAAMEAHVGNINISNWSPLSSWGFELFDTFEERIDAMVESLLISKAIPDNVMKVDLLRKFVAAPCREVGRKQNNKKVNQARDQQNAIGIHAQKNGLVVVDAYTKEVKNPHTGQVVAEVKGDVQDLPATLKRGRGGAQGGKRRKGNDGHVLPTA